MAATRRRRLHRHRPRPQHPTLQGAGPPLHVELLRVEGSGFRVEGLGLRVQDLGFWVHGLGLKWANKRIFDFLVLYVWSVLEHLSFLSPVVEENSLEFVVVTIMVRTVIIGNDIICN